MGRQPNNTSSIYRGRDGYWHGRVTVGVRDDGRPDRRHVMGSSQAEIIRKVRLLEQGRDSGSVRRPGGRTWTVEKWLRHWLDNIAGPFLRDNTVAGYEVAVRVHLIPGVGRHRLDKLEPEHLERLYVRMMTNGSAAATAHQAHRTIRTALNEALRRGYITRNPATLAKAPRIVEEEVEPYTVEEVHSILDTAAELRNGTRWAIALALGLRQGEALGLRWADVDLDLGLLVVRSSRQRPKWRHGCKPPCGRKYAGYCLQRQPLRAVVAETKSRAGRRSIGLPDELVALLRKHRGDQERDRLAAAQLWTEGGWVFSTPTGEAVNPRTDYDEWKRLLARSEVRDARLHDARHTAATVLLLLGVPERAVMGIMGWSNSAMAARYQHITAVIQRDVARRVGGLLWRQDGAGAGDE